MSAEVLVSAFDMALASPLPADLVCAVSTMLSPLEPAARLTADTMGHVCDVRPTIEALLATDTPGSTAALRLMTSMTSDRESQGRASTELARRSTPVPEWVERFSEIRAASPVRLVIDPLRGTETLVIGVDLVGIDLAAAMAALADLGLLPSDLGALAAHDSDLTLPPLPAFDAFTLVVTIDVSCGRRVPLEVLLVQHRHDSLAERLRTMDGPSSTVRDVSNRDARATLEHVLGGTDQVVPLGEDSASVLPLLRHVAGRLEE